MRRTGFIVGIILALLVGLAGPASASSQNNPGSCTISGGTVNWNVKEQPTEGSFDYISIASPVRLNLATHVNAYLNSTGAFIVGHDVYSSPVDGDGFWNYRADFNIVNNIGDWSGVGRVNVLIDQYASSSTCSSNTYI